VRVNSSVWLVRLVSGLCVVVCWVLVFCCCSVEYMCVCLMVMVVWLVKMVRIFSC